MQGYFLIYLARAIQTLHTCDVGCRHALDTIDTDAISPQMKYCGVYRTDA
ncbi:hypothetical protein COCVIDRAFT_108104 [Bipolaris victoriae FI3]|uniref:Uncharacterized protein n=1 Tax=Bipolaris victoriae (strain FI3) TaxID=930091 RepID=W7EHC8_BIPV3|nr:hypothetical protein COCVIDRAFT_108104 [Bipolaris victoriae FI3]